MLRHPPYLLLLIPALLSAVVLSGQSAHRHLRTGDKAWRNGAFDKAENSYRQAAQVAPGAQSRYNLGNALYEQKKYAEAAKEYEQAARSATDADTRARALHNLGNAHFQQNQWDKAIEAYKAALRNKPGDADTARNLALAQRKNSGQSAVDSGQSAVGGQQSQPETGEQRAEGREQRAEGKEQRAENAQSQPGTRNPEREAGNANDANNANARESEGTSKPGTRNPESGISNQKSEIRNPETDKLLQIMAREEQKVQQRLRRTGTAPPKSAKDW